MTNHEFKRSVIATLYRIATASKFAERTAIYQSEAERVIASTHLTLQWEKEEQALIWAIYQKAVFDQLGISIRIKRVTRIPNDTAFTGEITLYTGRRVNLLELLGIDPAWAAEQLDTLLNYTQRKAA